MYCDYYATCVNWLGEKIYCNDIRITEGDVSDTHDSSTATVPL